MGEEIFWMWKHHCQQCQNLAPLAPAPPNPILLLPSRVSSVLEVGRSQRSRSCWTLASANSPRTICSFPDHWRGGKIPFNFLSLHFVFKRPHTVQSFEIILWDSKACFQAIMIPGAASEPSLKERGEANWLWQEGKWPSNDLPRHQV